MPKKSNYAVYIEYVHIAIYTRVQLFYIYSY